jgi:hypothetical protein
MPVGVTEFCQSKYDTLTEYFIKHDRHHMLAVKARWRRYLPLIHHNEKVAGELMAVGCSLPGWKVYAAYGVSELAATSRHLFLALGPRETAGTIAAHLLH